VVRVRSLWLLIAALSVSACSGGLPNFDGMPNMDAGAMGCNNVERTTAGDAVLALGAAEGRLEPTDAGQVFADVALPNADPTRLAAMGVAAGFVVRFNMQYATSADGMAGYGECWCQAPLDGHVKGAFFGSEGQLFIELEHSPILGGRSQPLMGWGC
jgi:hypothetical protein